MSWDGTERRKMPRRVDDHCDAHQQNTQTLEDHSEQLTAIQTTISENRQTIKLVGWILGLLFVAVGGIISWYVSITRDDIKEISLALRANNELLIAGREKRIALEDRVNRWESRHDELRQLLEAHLRR